MMFLLSKSVKNATFAKNTAHIERCMLNNSYLCLVAENPS